MRRDMEQETRRLAESRAEVQSVRVRNTQVLTHVIASSKNGSCVHVWFCSSRLL
jgi:hypothetical protein